LRHVIERVVGDHQIRIIDSGEAVGKRVKSLLDEFGLGASADNKPQMEFITYSSEEYRLRLMAKAVEK
jgi:glutamate racemase